MGAFEETIEKLRAEIDAHVASLKSESAWREVEKLYRALGTLEELAGVSRTAFADLFGLSESVIAATVTQGEFMGMDALVAAKTYMEKKKAVASSLDEILSAIQKGGAQQIGRDSLSTKLSRSTWDVAKAPDQELYTLVRFLPHLRRGRKKSGQTGEPESTESDAPVVENSGGKE